MEDEKLIPETTDSQEQEPKSPLLRKRGPKPDIEGITVPMGGRLSNIGPKLTSEEKKLIDEADKPQVLETIKPATPRIVLPKHRPAYVKWLWTIVFLAALGFGGYSAYTQYINKPQQQADADNGPYSELSEKYGDSAASTSTTDTLPAQNSDAASTSTTTPATPPPPAQPMLKVASTPNGFLNVRQSPSTNSAILTKIHPGETYPYSEVQNDWYHITLPDGKTGWVAGQYITKM